MKIATMQKIDFYVGVPASFALALCLKLKRIFLPIKKQIPSPVKRVLFIELSEMGSMVLLSPLIGKVKKTYPEAEINFITFHSTAPALRLLRQVDEANIMTLRTSSLPLFFWDVLCTLIKIIRLPFDITFDLELFSRISGMLSLFSAASVRVGFHNFKAEGLYRGNFITHPVTYNPHLHITKNFLSMFYALHEQWGDIPHSKYCVPDADMQLDLEAFSKEKILLFEQRLYAAHPVLKDISKLVVLNPNSSQVMPLRRWPLQSYQALAAKLLEDSNLAIVVTGIKEEKKDAEFICNQLSNARIIDLTGFTDMEELIALYHLANVLVSNDSGPAHFSALAGINAIILFGPETPGLYGSLNPNAYAFYKHLQCSPCSTAYNQRRSPCANNMCMKLITVDEVYAKALSMLSL